MDTEKFKNYFRHVSTSVFPLFDQSKTSWHGRCVSQRSHVIEEWSCDYLLADWLRSLESQHKDIRKFEEFQARKLRNSAVHSILFVLTLLCCTPETFEQSRGHSRQENVYHATKDTSDDTKEKEKEADTLGRTWRAFIYCTVSICRLAGKSAAGSLFLCSRQKGGKWFWQVCTEARARLIC